MRSVHPLLKMLWYAQHPPGKITGHEKAWVKCVLGNDVVGVVVSPCSSPPPRKVQHCQGTGEGGRVLL